MCCCYKQRRLNKCTGSRYTSQPERESKCSLPKQPAGGGSAPRGHFSEMGCSSGPDRSLSRDGSIPAAGAREPEDLSTLERLAQATGGTEESWYRCVFPFGVISLVIGVAGSGVTFSFNTLPQTRVLSLVLLVLGFVLLLVAAACWRAHRSRRREKKEAGIFGSELYTL
ncbi:hypothetical protein R3I93_017519 [Phoxinus phoxinus]|uniref:Transmembrane protein 100 n=1 Tax=Phoxinus phoxinus TaxID=58324 RepID=A0AAN9GX31_9TELE